MSPPEQRRSLQCDHAKNSVTRTNTTKNHGLISSSSLPTATQIDGNKSKRSLNHKNKTE
jgi:hypothetical protein